MRTYLVILLILITLSGYSQSQNSANDELPPVSNLPEGATLVDPPTTTIPYGVNVKASQECIDIYPNDKQHAQQDQPIGDPQMAKADSENNKSIIILLSVIAILLVVILISLNRSRHIRNVALLALFFSIVSFNTPTRYYPDFIVRYDLEVLPGDPASELFYNGKYVSNNKDPFFSDVDSVAVKYIVKNDLMYKTVYTNFYSRAGDNQWKKYGPDKQFIGIITEHKNEIGIEQENVVYYRVY
jgi:hypothetical protein